MIAALPAEVRAFLAHAGARPAASRLTGARVPVVIAACGGVYGAIMASHGGIAGERAWMVLFGAVKVPLLFTATMALAVPFFYVANLATGVGGSFGRVWRGLVDFQLAVAPQLAAAAPVTLLVNLSQEDYRVAQGWSTLLFGIAAWNARFSLGRAYAPLEARARAHRWLRTGWFVLYAFVGVQMAWDLRPFVGNPELPVTFFRDEVGNASVETPRVLWEGVRSLAP